MTAKQHTTPRGNLMPTVPLAGKHPGGSKTASPNYSSVEVTPTDPKGQPTIPPGASGPGEPRATFPQK